MINLLDEKILTVVNNDETIEKHSLASIMVALSNNKVKSFLKIRPHQEDAVYMFLSFIASNVADQNHIPAQDVFKLAEKQWRDELIKLTDNNDNAWNLITDDLSEPAFLQFRFDNARNVNKLSGLDALKELKRIRIDDPSVDDKEQTEEIKSNNIPFESFYCFPDEVDVLIAAKNNILKLQLIQHADPEHWVFALISATTQSSWLSAKTGRLFAMRQVNAYAPRLCVEINYINNLSLRWQIAVTRLLDYCNEVDPDRNSLNNKNGIRTVWTHKFNNNDQLHMKDLHPLFIDLGIYLRLACEENIIIACKFNFNNKIDYKFNDNITVNQILKDPWTPQTKDKTGNILGWKAPMGGPIFTPIQLSDFLTSDKIIQPHMCVINEALLKREEEHLFLHASGLVKANRAQQASFEIKNIEIPNKIRRYFGSDEYRQTFGDITKTGINIGSEYGKILNKIISYIYKDIDHSTNRVPPRFSSLIAKNKVNTLFENYWSNNFFTDVWEFLEGINETKKYDLITYKSEWIGRLNKFVQDNVLPYIPEILPNTMEKSLVLAKINNRYTFLQKKYTTTVAK